MSHSNVETRRTHDRAGEYDHVRGDEPSGTLDAPHAPHQPHHTHEMPGYVMFLFVSFHLFYTSIIHTYHYILVATVATEYQYVF